MSGSPRSSITRPVAASAAARARRRGRRADGVALRVEDAHEARRDRVVVLDDQDPGPAMPTKVTGAAGAPANFDLALTCARPGADPPLRSVAAMSRSLPRRRRDRRRPRAERERLRQLVLERQPVVRRRRRRRRRQAVNPNAPEVSPPGDIPDNQAYVPYAPPGAATRSRSPRAGRARAAGGATSFTDKLNTIRVEAVPAHAPLTVATPSGPRSRSSRRPTRRSSRAPSARSRGRPARRSGSPTWRRAARPRDRQARPGARSSATCSSTTAATSC